MNEQHACDLCGALCEASALTEFSRQQLCPTCLENETRICCHGFERIWADDNDGDASRSLCRFCYGRYYVKCDLCARVIPSVEVLYSYDE